MTSITIPKGVIAIGERAFRGCVALTELHFEEGIRITALEQDTFPDSPLGDVVVPASVTEIRNGAFGQVERLTFEIPEGWLSYAWGSPEASEYYTYYTAEQLSDPEATAELFRASMSDWREWKRLPLVEK